MVFLNRVLSDEEKGKPRARGRGCPMAAEKDNSWMLGALG